ncbi:MAG: hypothetical protein RL632_116 [Bacteroidota bacterium]|jgi:uncharacterized protein
MSELIDHVKQHVREVFAADTTGHDWHHIERVYTMACYLQEHEGGDREVVELAALLHDISDHKLNGGKLNDGARVAEIVLKNFDCPLDLVQKVCDIIDRVSFKGAKVTDTMESLEGKIVQDADRLDSIGAIGIARAFAYGGSKNRPMYQPEVGHELHSDFETYANAKSHTINHFYEKLLLLKSRLHTPTAIHIGEERHAYMEQFLNQFYREWNGKND